ncbi:MULTISPECIES: sugar phosphorylase [unclassified Methylophaga]|uniref:sugar phosphorylase n=2 Tax=Methylophaga TaxID=40222 RepID=UPI000C8FFB99|nr:MULTISPECIES: sugar phosphorylase [unclassified Methylophaga]MAK67283.1 alpha-amylase [Methylophaga sp.]MAY18320.1 alpha-amylase [Methylophaga sp.]HCD06011.1 alpha-amylase [Methylophaga sp.]
MTSTSERPAVFQNVLYHLNTVYGELKDPEMLAALTNELLAIMRVNPEAQSPQPHQNKWQASDIAMITYGNSVLKTGESPLQTLKHFLDDYFADCINTVHILPFFPYCSDDGFAVKDFFQVNPELGDWGDINAIAKDYRLMADLVINHGSSSSQWFQNFIAGQGEGHDFFYTCEADTPVSLVVRPRITPLLRQTETAQGIKHVWCTFSHEQVDFDFRNTEVLKTFVKIIRFYLDQGVRLFRLDAVAFLWKQAGTNCLNLPQTHELIRLLRLLIEQAQSDAVIITETNIPNRENLSYFGNANEAHWIYNFSLPPLLLNTLISGNCRYLRQWLMSMPPAQNGTAYFNFIASHDGIGLRPAEGLLTDNEIAALISTMQGFGGEISWRAAENGIKKPYEINIALFDALQGTVKGPDQWQQARFICAHAIMLALEGIPGIYIHSLLATGNDYQRLAKHQHNRAINRHQWDDSAIRTALKHPANNHSQIYQKLTGLITLRTQHSAFHPNATQYTLQLGDALFGFWRQSIDRRQSIFCIFNITDQPQTLRIADLNLVATDDWHDLVSGEAIDSWQIEIQLSPYQCAWLSNR